MPAKFQSVPIRAMQTCMRLPQPEGFGSCALSLWARMVATRLAGTRTMSSLLAFVRLHKKKIAPATSIKAIFQCKAFGRAHHLFVTGCGLPLSHLHRFLPSSDCAGACPSDVLRLAASCFAPTIPRCRRQSGPLSQSSSTEPSKL